VDTVKSKAEAEVKGQIRIPRIDGVAVEFFTSALTLA
jgi:hypothetical protein